MPHGPSPILPFGGRARRDRAEGAKMARKGVTYRGYGTDGAIFEHRRCLECGRVETIPGVTCGVRVVGGADETAAVRMHNPYSFVLTDCECERVSAAK